MSEESAAAVAESMVLPPNKLEDASVDKRLRDKDDDDEGDVDEEEEEGVVLRSPNEEEKEDPAVEEMRPGDTIQEGKI